MINNNKIRDFYENNGKPIFGMLVALFMAVFILFDRQIFLVTPLPLALLFIILLGPRDPSGSFHKKNLLLASLLTLPLLGASLLFYIEQQQRKAFQQYLIKNQCHLKADGDVLEVGESCDRFGNCSARTITIEPEYSCHGGTEKTINYDSFKLIGRN
jgi:uncharacterized membrane protein